MYLDVLAELIKLLGPFLLSMENGRASGGTSNTLVDNTKTWKTDMWKGAYVHIYDGTGKGQIRKIISNTSDTLTVDEDWTEIPDDTSKYRIFISFSEDSVVFQDIKSLIESINNKTVKVDTDNVKVVSEVAYDSDNDLKKIRIDVDNAGLAKEDTLSAIKNALDSVGTDKIRASIVDALPESPFNVTKVAGTALTGRDWSSDFAKLQNLDLALSSLRDDLRGVDSKTLTDLYNKINDLLTELQSVNAKGSITSADNTDGFEVTLDKGGRRHVDVYYKLGDAADLIIEVSNDGNTWRPYYSTSFSASTEDVYSFESAFRYVRVRTPTTNIDVEFEITATR